MSRVIAASAIGTLMSYGYTEAEARRIRAFLPRRFETFGFPLPATNIDAWLIHRAVKHYLFQHNERGVFKPYANNNGYLSMQHTETMSYVTANEEITFTTVEFVRHFGDAFFTDMSEDAGKRIIRMNADGSFVIKNRRLEQLFREMEQRAKPTDGPSNHFTPYASISLGEFRLPKDEVYSAKDMYELYMHGKLAQEYVTDYNFRRVLLSGLDHLKVTKYLYFLYCARLKDQPHGQAYHGERFFIMGNLSNREPNGHTYFPHQRGGMIFFEDNTVLTRNGSMIVPPVQMNMNTLPSGYQATHGMARISLNGQWHASPVIPLSVKQYFSDDEWLQALA